MLYHSLADSYIEYGISSYGRTYNTYLNQIYNLQIKILKNIVTNNIQHQFYNNDKGLFSHCKILPVHTKAQLAILKEHFFNDELKRKIDHPVNTRAMARNRLQTTSAKNTYGERTAEYIVPRLINKLPIELINKITPMNYKTKLKSYFIENMHA
ncbi:hypothetical protein JYU34_016566 [Plutella xylostella]|uniref:Uncharacterized protein n=1 Tax=Plutella xylostella TaxID=51655 RepID=A0ABQ7Q4B0_PLUXY|nr:hypothetical protein JYU34_016566 [Plutella xylostella]